MACLVRLELACCISGYKVSSDFLLAVFRVICIYVIVCDRPTEAFWALIANITSFANILRQMVIPIRSLQGHLRENMI